VKVEFEPAAEQEIGDAIHRYFVEAGLLHAIGFDNEVKRLVELLLSRPNLSAHRDSRKPAPFHSNGTPTPCTTE
jgi:hypothetical protein